MRKSEVSDSDILHAISQMDNPPNSNSISNALNTAGFETNHMVVRSHLSSNPALSEAAESRALKIIENIPISGLFKKVNLKEWNIGILPPHLSHIVYRRIDAEIMSVINQMQDITNPVSITNVLNAKGLAINRSSVYTRLSANPALRKAADSRTSKVIKTVHSTDLFGKVSSKKWRLCSFADSASNLAHSSIDAQILSAIKDLKTIPTLSAISSALKSKEIEFSVTSIFSRLSANPALSKAVDSRASEIIEATPTDILFNSIFSKKRNPGLLSLNTIRTLHSRVDAELLAVVEQMEGPINPASISRAMGSRGLPVTPSTVSSRLSSNYALFKAVYSHSDLNEDQFARLCTSKRNHSFHSEVSKSIHNFGVFKESLAISKSQDSLFPNSPKWKLEISNYPAPLFEAQAFLLPSTTPRVDYHPLKTALDPAHGIPYSNNSVPAIVISSSLHLARSAKPLGFFFREVSRVLESGGRVVITVPSDYVLSANFSLQMNRLGLTVVEKCLKCTSLSGAQMDLRDSISASAQVDSNIFVLQKSGPARAPVVIVNPLVKSTSKNGLCADAEVRVRKPPRAPRECAPAVVNPSVRTTPMLSPEVVSRIIEREKLNLMISKAARTTTVRASDGSIIGKGTSAASVANI